jgi:hypothetical protein
MRFDFNDCHFTGQRFVFALCGCQKMSGNHPREFKKRSLPIIRMHNETLTIVAMRISNPDRSPVGIHGCG